jgi:HD-GYP domain-containing protein (c-di-GMP phosphodiesterase class II)
LIQAEPAGILVLANPDNGAFKEEVQTLLMLLSREASLILSTFRANERLNESYGDVVQALARAIDARDAYTHHHSDRTRSLVRSLGDEFRLPSQMIAHIEQGALLHDLGKVGIDDAILRKPGKLTTEEYAFMKKHPGIGYRILQPISHLQAAAAIVLYHQEWFNGQGYPEGLAGEEIPLGARLVSVIDAWDAMTSNRPYRNAMPKSAAIAELRRAAGTQFDPRAVDAFVRVVERLDREGIVTTERNVAEPASSATPA